MCVCVCVCISRERERGKREEKHDGAKINFLPFLHQKLFLKNNFGKIQSFWP